MAIIYPYIDIYKGDPYYDTNTVSINEDDATLVGDTTVWSGTNIGSDSMVVLDYNTNKTPLFVSSVTDNTNIELTSTWPKVDVSGVSYFIDNSDGSDNWLIRIFPNRRQYSGQSISVITPIPLDQTANIGRISTMPLGNSKKKLHIDGEIWIDSVTKSGVTTPADVEDALRELQDYNGLLGCRYLDKNLTGSSEGVIIKTFNIDDKRTTRVYDNRNHATGKWHAPIKIDLIPCYEL